MQGKRDFKILSEKIAEQGAVVFTAEWPTYSGTSTQGGNSQQIREMSETLVCAVRYADAHATDYGGDPERIIYAGFSLSAGMGGLILMAGESLEEGWKTLVENSGEPIDPIDCVVTEGSAKVEAFVGIAGPYGMFDENRDENPDRWALISPSQQLGRNPDLLVRLLHGEIDATVPVEASESVQQALTAAGYDSTLTLFDEGHKVPHELTLATIADLVEKLSTE